MSRVYVTKEVTFDTAHQLLNHLGLCKNIHGHTYKVQVTVTAPVTQQGSKNPSEGMIVDFKELKQLIKDVIVNNYDHTYVAAGDEPILDKIKELGLKLHIIGVRPTAENMAVVMFDELQQAIQDNYFSFPNIELEKIRVYETPTSWADYMG
jgi:6-pyruvoyltetrahydropterin/6-carboxytetrahydropterin synthase